MTYVIKKKDCNQYFEATKMVTSVSGDIERWAEKMPCYTEFKSIAKHFDTLEEAQRCMDKEIWFQEFNEIIEA